MIITWRWVSWTTYLFRGHHFPIKKDWMPWMWNKEKDESKEWLWKEVSPNKEVCPWCILSAAPTGWSVCSPKQSTCGVCAGLMHQAHFLHRLKWTCKQRCVKEPWLFRALCLKLSRQKYRSNGCEGSRCQYSVVYLPRN